LTPDARIDDRNHHTALEDDRETQNHARRPEDRSMTTHGVFLLVQL